MLRPTPLCVLAAVLLSTGLSGSRAQTAPAPDAATQAFHQTIRPLLVKYCYDCHGDGAAKGKVAFDGFASDRELIAQRDLWWKALKNVRSGLMPADDGPRPTAAEIAQLEKWIKFDAFALDPTQLDPGRTVVRRLNRVEYRNTIRDLTGYDFDTQKEFPADDTGHGFDNIGAVLTISPMLLEKYLDAAQTIIASTVPMAPTVVAEQTIAGSQFKAVVHERPTADASATPRESRPPTPVPVEPRRGRTRATDAPPATPAHPAPMIEGGALAFSYYTAASATMTHPVTIGGKYQLVFDFRASERYVEDQFDYNKCRLVLKADGETLLEREFMREGGKKFEFAFDREWAPGDHTFSVEITPVLPEKPQIRQLRMRLNSLTLRGPLEEKYWVRPAGYAKIFPRDVPADAAGRRSYARELLETFATRAFRRPPGAASLDKLVALAESVAAQPRSTFEAGIAQAMIAVLASPRFIFREEETQPLRPGERYPRVDDYALASRLSYFLWSSMPDDELFRLARENTLHAHLPAQIERMLGDARSSELVRNFTGQWLQARDIANIQITPLDVYLRDHPSPEYDEARATFRRGRGGRGTPRTPEQEAAAAKAREVVAKFNALPKPTLTSELRRAMQQETEMVFSHILKTDRSLLELIESDYTFLNQELAKHYGIEGVTGDRMRKVALPPDSPRGGVLTQGTVLTVTSNPTRTSPVKRGVFILDAILGMPPAPPPPNIPSLEDAATPAQLKAMTLRETLALHAQDALCRSCHNRMDPVGLALENFNAMGMWRTSELNQPIDAAGKLITGEPFSDVRTLKHILATERRLDFYRCFTEKFLTYALGRGLEYYDVELVDQLVAQVEKSGGRPQVLLRGIINSAPFQQRRPTRPSVASSASRALPSSHE